MARKEINVTIQDEGRDKGKVFHIIEMPASQAEAWAMKVLLALAKSGVDLDESVLNAGWAGVAVLGFKALGSINPDDALPLFNEMLDCIQIIPNPSIPNVIRRLVENDIEEVATRLKLRLEVFYLHGNFSRPAVQSKSISETTTTQDRAGLSNTPMSPQQ